MQSRSQSVGGSKIIRVHAGSRAPSERDFTLDDDFSDIAMATLLKVQQKNAKKADGKGKSRATEDDEEVEMKRESTSTAAEQKRRNKQRVLMLSSRGVTQRMRHLMKDLEMLLPHVKKGERSRLLCPHLPILLGVTDAKLGSKGELYVINELADLNNCNNCLFFEARRHEDLYLWAVKTPNGPSIRMHVQNIHTMDELKMTGNCLKGSRGLLSFDAGFDSSEHWKLVKEVFTHVSCFKSDIPYAL